MTNAEMLTAVKKALNITGTYLDDTLSIYIETVTGFLSGCGIPESEIKAGLVARGVSDIWNYGQADGKYSEAFLMMAKQAALNSKG